MWLGLQHLSPTPLCCSAAGIMQHRSLQRFYQVLKSGQVRIFSLLQVEKPLHCATVDMDRLPAGFPMETRL